MADKRGFTVIAAGDFILFAARDAEMVGSLTASASDSLEIQSLPANFSSKKEMYLCNQP